MLLLLNVVSFDCVTILVVGENMETIKQRDVSDVISSLGIHGYFGGIDTE